MNLAALVRRLIVPALLLVPMGAQAATISLFSSLDGAQAGIASPGTGTGIVTYDDVSNLLSWDIGFSGLLAGTTVAHFHGPALPGVSAGVQVGIPLGSSLGQTSGTLLGSATITDTQETQLLANLWYINIHTSLYPGGEIRGQVEVVPVPAALWLFGSGLLAVLGLVKRRRRG
jgi:CHRD domain